MRISYEELHPSSVTEHDVTDIAALKPLLTERGAPVTLEGVQAAANTSHVLVARLDAEDPKRRSRIVGLGRLVVTNSPFTGRDAIVADVVVARKCRGKGFGRTINKLLINLAKEKGAKNIWLRTNSRRVEAHAVYKSLGFTKKDSSVYGMDL